MPRSAKPLLDDALDDVMLNVLELISAPPSLRGMKKSRSAYAKRAHQFKMKMATGGLGALRLEPIL